MRLLPFFSLTFLAALVSVALTGCGFSKANSSTAFLGDSITEGWSYPRADFGVHGNTTAQMLHRFPAVIPWHGYRQVVILGGTNDVLLKINPDVTIHNLGQLGDDTVRVGAEPLLGEIPPIFHSFNPRDRTDYSAAVRLLNQRIKRLASEHGWTLIDYYDPILGHPSYSSDGVHMKRRGYLVMEFALLRAEGEQNVKTITPGANGERLFSDLRPFEPGF